MTTPNRTEAERQWLQQRLKRRAPTSTSSLISRQPRHAPIPLSFAQQRLWFLNQLEPESSAYLMSWAFHLHGTLQLPALEGGLRFLVQRHESLRTAFGMERDVPVQIISPEVPVPILFEDLQQQPATEQTQEVNRILHDEAHHPIDLMSGPLFRFRILKLGAEDHIFLVTLHHIISDGWSMGVFFRELATAYTALVDQAELSLPELSIQYADYAVWQRKYLQGDELERQLAYWREQLQAPVPTLSLPIDNPRPAIQTFRGAIVNFSLPPSLIKGIQTVSQSAQASIFMTLLTAFQILLQRLSGQDDVCVGIPSAGRTRQEIEPVMGFFINTLVIRANLANKPTFGELLAQVRRKCLDAYTNQDVPFEKLVEVLQPARAVNHPPFFQVLFNMRGYPKVR
ncbi:MAG: condensation domain-containing protein [Nitrospirales bacterium]